VSDAIEAYLSAWRRIEAVQGRAFNLGGTPANAVSLRQLLRFIEELLGRPVELDFSEWRAGDQRYYVSDTRAFTRATGWRPRVAPPEGVQMLHDWLVANRSEAARAAAAA
jgi:CDP-paratose 2-epimerase